MSNSNTITSANKEYLPLLKPLQKVLLGNTGLEVSRLGLGTVKFGRNIEVKYPKAFQIPDDNAIKHLLDLAKELGINLLDTAPAYGCSEERLGQALKNDRHNWYISSKVGEEFINGKSYFNFTEQHLISSITRSLKRLNTDYLDLLLIHSDGNDEDLINHHRVFEILAKFKQQGLIRAFGMSSKTINGGILTAQLSDVVMVDLNPNYLDCIPVINEAYKLNKGVLLKKAFGSGHINAKTSLEFLLNLNKNSQLKGIHSIIMGTINPRHLIENVQYAVTLE